MTEFVPAEDMDENTEYITTGSADLNRILAVIWEFCGAKQVTGRKIVQGKDVRFYLIGSIILLFTGILALWLGFFLGSVPDVRGSYGNGRYNLYRSSRNFDLRWVHTFS